jgi:antitoxin YqcF
MATQEQRLIAKTAANIFGGEASVAEYWDNAHKSKVAILECRNSPGVGLGSYSTVGLSAYNVGYTVDDKDLRVEIVGAVRLGNGYFSNIIATCGFNIINDQFACYPGAVFPHVVSEYNKAGEVSHVVFVSPGMWAHEFENIILDDKVITWLMAVPITERELQFLHEHNLDALETVFEDNQTDVFDLTRRSAI